MTHSKTARIAFRRQDIRGSLSLLMKLEHKNQIELGSTIEHNTIEEVNALKHACSTSRLKLI